jgi:hypothetical protein
LNHENHLHFLHGRLIIDEHVVQGFAAAIAPDGQFAGVLEGDPEQGAWRPRKVFTYP